MRKLSATVAALIIACGASAGGVFPYQATLRNADGSFISNRNLTLTVSIVAGSVDAAPVYSERHKLVSDDRGTIEASIGSGEPLVSAFDAIDWACGESFYMTVEALPEGGEAVVSSQQMLSVPMAAIADATESLTVTASDGNTYALVVDDYGNLETIKMPKGYSRLVFHDSFNGTGLPDADKWNFNDRGRINSELQYYTFERPENVFMEDGLLHIRCINNDTIRDENGMILNEIADKNGDKHCITSGRIQTKGQHDWTYCYVEARIKVPIASGTWPAVWMMPTKNEYGYWPNSGEIDIMEHIGNEPLVYHCALHHRNGDKGGSKQLLDADDWHVIGFNWTAEKMEWLIDDKVYCRITNPGTNWGDWPYNRDFHLILNFAFGGGWGGQAGINPDALPLDFLVDYVRVFKE